MTEVTGLPGHNKRRTPEKPKTIAPRRCAKCKRIIKKGETFYVVYKTGPVCSPCMDIEV